MRRIIASHVADYNQQWFAMMVVPHNYAVGVDGGMDVIIESMQLYIGKYIEHPQKEERLPTHAVVFADISSVYNRVSSEELMDIIQTDYSKLLSLVYLFYGSPGSIHHHWEKDGAWRALLVLEGVKQGCPLSAIFVALVLDRVLCSLDALLCQRANDRLLSGDLGDDDHGSITHLSGWVDDVTAGVPLVDLKFFCDKFPELAAPLGLKLNPYKTHILTSCSSISIFPTLHATNPSLVLEIKSTIAAYSITKAKAPNNTATHIERISGFQLLGTPVGSAEFAADFFTKQVEEVCRKITALEASIPDLHTHLRMFV